MNRTTPLLALAVTACSTIGVHNRPILHWAGPATPTADPAHCPPTHAILTLREGTAVFAPDSGTWILSGKAGPDTLALTQSRTTSEHKIYKTEFQAHWTEQTVTGTYTTPFCTYKVELTSY